MLAICNSLQYTVLRVVALIMLIGPLIASMNNVRAWMPAELWICLIPDSNFKFQLNWLSTLRAPGIAKALYRNLQAAACPSLKQLLHRLLSIIMKCVI
jgi:hypothetical protein